MKDYELGIKPKPKTTPDKDFIANHRDAIIYQLVCEYLGEHAGMQDALTLWTAFKAKKKVRLVATGEEVYIHSIQSHIEWETHKAQTRYTICKSKDTDEFKSEYMSGLMTCQQGELECVKA